MFDYVFNFVDTTVIGNISTLAVVFMSIIKPLMGACVGLYAVYFAYKALFDPANLMVMESVNFLVTLALVTSIAFGTDLYINKLVPIALDIGDDIATKLVGGSGASNALQTMFDNLVLRIIDISANTTLEFLDGDSWIRFILTYQLIFVTVIGALPFIAVAFAYLLVAKIMMSFLLIIGPLFIMMSFFPSTRSFFQAWTGQIFNYALLTLIYPLAFTTFEAILNYTVFGQAVSLTACYMSLIMFVALLLISIQIPTFCSSLSGGVGINGLVGGVGVLGRMGKGLGGLLGKPSIPNPVGKNKISAG
ncbi:type IV secretion system protein [Shewanella sp. M16]|uniref:type IV secretion system protein n=1 Tax=Shewanella sp. M16 TaxID=2830837 RepID=UPI001BAF4D23|nr:type IV secretion system protein [Shewanella sp. M16]MBS0044841.1 type IV secretion system protein [Shewanella sp. M16]